jgi:hypothetical protein
MKFSPTPPFPISPQEHSSAALFAAKAASPITGAVDAGGEEGTAGAPGRPFVGRPAAGALSSSRFAQVRR